MAVPGIDVGKRVILGCWIGHENRCDEMPATVEPPDEAKDEAAAKQQIE